MDYVQIAGVLVHLDEMLGQGRAHLVDPSVIKLATEASLHSMVLPGSNVCREDMNSVRDSWRAEVFEIFRDYTVEQTAYLTTFMDLVRFSDKVAASSSVRLAHCAASDECRARDIDVPIHGLECPGCGARLFPTDALRIHEEVSEEHTNETALGRLMTSLEHLTMVAYIDYLAKRKATTLSSVAFMLDGPLALFGPQAWLHNAIQGYLADLYENLDRQGLRFPVVLGIEKRGQFAEHAIAMGDRITPRSLMKLPDDYIYQHILTFRAPAGVSYGRDTYYGQKFFYRASQGQLFTITVPKVTGAFADQHEPRHYPTLPDTLALLDHVGTALYQDAAIPIALAHSFASIPLRTGSRVLTLLSKHLLGQS